MRLSTDAQSAYVTGNVVYLTASGNSLEISAGSGTLRHGGNWYKPGYVSAFGTITGSVVDTGGTVTGSDPGFVNAAGQDFHLVESSALRGKAVAPPAETSAYPLSRQYVKHQSSELRPTGSTLDIGALGYGTPSSGPDGGTGSPDGGGARRTPERDRALRMEAPGIRMAASSLPTTRRTPDVTVAPRAALRSRLRSCSDCWGSCRGGRCAHEPAPHKGLASVNPLSVPLPHGTEVITRVDRVSGERRVPQGVVGRVVRARDGGFDVQIVGVGEVWYAREELVPREGQVQFARRRAAAWDALRPCVVLEATVGSRAWGLAHEGSDTDLRGVFALPLSLDAAAWRRRPGTSSAPTAAPPTGRRARRCDQALRARPQHAGAALRPLAPRPRTCSASGCWPSARPSCPRPSSAASAATR